MHVRFAGLGDDGTLVMGTADPGTLTAAPDDSSGVLGPGGTGYGASPTGSVIDSSGTLTLPAGVTPVAPVANSATGRFTGDGQPATPGMPECSSYNWWQSLWDPAHSGCMESQALVASAQGKQQALNTAVSTLTNLTPILVVGGVVLAIMILPPMMNQGRR